MVSRLICLPNLAYLPSVTAKELAASQLDFELFHALFTFFCSFSQFTYILLIPLRVVSQLLLCSREGEVEESLAHLVEDGFILIRKLKLGL